LRATLNAAKNAIKNPAAAAKLNVKVGPQAKKLSEKTKADLERWQHYDTDPELYRQLVEEAGVAKEEAPKAETPQAPAETPQAPEETPKSAPKTEEKTPKVEEKPKAPEVKKAEAESKTDEGRFNPDSETPLLSTEEDKNDFQLVGETAVEVKKREAAEAKAEEQAQQRTEDAAKRETGELFGEEKQFAPTETTPKGDTRLYSRKGSPMTRDSEFSHVVNGVEIKSISGNIGKYFDNIKDALHALYRKAFLDRSQNKSFVNFAEISTNERKMLSKISGVDLSRARFHGIDESGIRHLDKHHGKAELRVDQEPITEDDIEKIPDIVRGTEPEYLGTNDVGNHVFQYKKRIGNEYFYLEEYRNGRGKLSGASLWKKKDTTVAQTSVENHNGMPTPEALHPRANSDNITDAVKNSSAEQENSSQDRLASDMASALKQKFGSGNTSLRQVAAGFKKIEFQPDTVNLDLGGGKFDEATEYLAEKGVTNLVFDPVNRDAEHNMRIFEAVKNGGVDTVTCNNVLNVIAEPAARDNVILQAAKALKPDGTAYFTVYEGDGSGTGRQSQADAWQENRKTADYLEEVEKHFGDVSLKNKVITAQQPLTDGKQSAWFMDARFEDPKLYSLKMPHQQLNPIREAGAIRDEHQARIDEKYTVRPNTEVNRDAERTIERMGGIQGAIDAISAGDYTPTTDTAQRVVQVVLNSKEFKNSDAAVRGKIADIYINHLGTEVARALAARRLGALNLANLQSIQAHVNAFMAKIDQLKPDNDLRKKILDEFGFDIDALPDEVLKDQKQLDALIRKLAAERANGWSKLYEYWINAILSGPSTHAANIMGNTANALYELGVKRFTEALVNTVAKRKDAATFGEFKEMIHAVDWRNAFRRAKLAFDYEALSVDGGKLEQVRTAIGGKKGQLIRTPGRLLRAADEFAKTLIQPIEAADQRGGSLDAISRRRSNFSPSATNVPSPTAWKVRRSARSGFSHARTHSRTTIPWPST